MNQSFKIISHDMTAERWHCLFCMLWRLVFVVRIHCFHFRHNGLRLPFVSLLCRKISFELSSKPKRNQETSSQKHMLSRGRCGIPLHSSEIYNYKKWIGTCLVPRPHYSARPKRFGSRGPIENVSRPFASDTSPK